MFCCPAGERGSSTKAEGAQERRDEDGVQKTLVSNCPFEVSHQPARNETNKCLQALNKSSGRMPNVLLVPGVLDAEEAATLVSRAEEAGFELQTSRGPAFGEAIRHLDIGNPRKRNAPPCAAHVAQGIITEFLSTIHTSLMHFGMEDGSVSGLFVCSRRVRKA